MQLEERTCSDCHPIRYSIQRLHFTSVSFQSSPFVFHGFLAVLGRQILLFDASLVLLCNFLLLLFDTEVSIGSFWNRCRVLVAFLSNDVVDDRWSFYGYVGVTFLVIFFSFLRRISFLVAFSDDCVVEIPFSVSFACRFRFR